MAHWPAQQRGPSLTASTTSNPIETYFERVIRVKAEQVAGMQGQGASASSAGQMGMDAGGAAGGVLALDAMAMRDLTCV